MDNRSDIRVAIDNSKLMTKLSVFGCIIALVLLITTVALGVIKSKFAGSDVFALAAIPYSLAFLFALSGLIYGMLSSAASLEDEEKLLLEKRRETNALNVEEDVRFTSGRSFENYRKYAPYAMAVLAGLTVIVILLGFRNGWVARGAALLKADNPLNSALVAFIISCVSVFTGAFYVGQSRLGSFRWLRPVGAWLLAGAGVMFCALVSAIFQYNKIITVDAYIAKVLFWIFVVLGCELAVNFIIEFYRPRTLEEPRPIFESRFLALFTEPGGVMRNIADALDYQFGFKVSGTWLFNSIERSFFPVVILWLLILWLFTGVHEVGPSQVGVRETFGKVTSKTLLEPGIYYALPWPMGKVNRFSCTELHQVDVGLNVADKEEKKRSAVVLWTAEHANGESNFIVAVAPSSDRKEANASDASISFVKMVIPIKYHIRKEQLMDYAYNNANPQNMILRIGEQVATDYLSSTSLMDVMSVDRAKAEAIMQQKIQKMTDARNLGVDIVSVSILDAHPPIEKVAPAFQNVIGAMEEKETEILKAKNYAAKLLPESEARAIQIKAESESYKYMTMTIAQAENARFKTQLMTYEIMPSMFRLNAYLDFLEVDCRDIRKFVVASGLDNEVYELNFEQKERLDLIDTDITKLK